MRVYKVEHPKLAFVFKSTPEGDNFEELEKDVLGEGGTVEKYTDEIAIITLEGATYTLPLGFAVFPEEAGKIVSLDTFTNTCKVAGTLLSITETAIWDWIKDDVEALIDSKLTSAVKSTEGKSKEKSDKQSKQQGQGD